MNGLPPHPSKPLAPEGSVSRFITLRKEVHAKVKQLAFEMKQTIPTTLAILIDDGLKYVEAEHPLHKEG
jgi:hypothetical protein